MAIPWTDHRAHYRSVKRETDRAIHDALRRGTHTRDEHVQAFEQAFATFCGTEYGVAVGSGSEAITIALKALDIGLGDEVISVANSCWSVPVAIAHGGAYIVLVDIEGQTYNIDPHTTSPPRSAARAPATGIPIRRVPGG